MSYMEVSEKMLALAIAEWERRVRATPEAFGTPEELAAKTPEQTGEDCARYLYELLYEGPSYTDMLMAGAGVEDCGQEELLPKQST